MFNLISKDTIVKEEALDLNGCNKISLDFFNQVIDVSLTDDDKLNIVQLADDSCKEEDKFIAKRIGEVIEIKTESNNKFKVKIGRINRNIKVSIPRSYGKCLDIKTGIGSININDSLKLENLNVESGSGNFKCENMLEGNKIIIKSTIGNVGLNEVAAKICNLETTSGGIKGCSINADKLSIKGSLGNITLNKMISKEIEVESSSGELSVDSLNGDDISIKSTLGNIILNNIASERIKIETSSGKVSIGTINGDDIDIKSNLGNVSLTELISNLYKVETISGKIKIDSINGSGNVSAQLGNIDINYKDIEEYSTVKAAAGNVNIFVPKGLSLEFWAECTSAEIRSNFDINYKTPRGNKASVLIGSEPYKKLNVSTTLGNIHFNEK